MGGIKYSNKAQQRIQLLQRIYDVADGRLDKSVNFDELAAQQGLTPSEAEDILGYLIREKWVVQLQNAYAVVARGGGARLTNHLPDTPVPENFRHLFAEPVRDRQPNFSEAPISQPDLVQLTHVGRKKVEELDAEKEGRNTLPHSIHISGDGNVVGDKNNVSVKKTAVSSGASMSDFTALLDQVHNVLDSGVLDSKTARIIKSDLEIVEGEVAEEKPDKSIVEAKLASIAAIAGNAASIATSSGTLVPVIQQAIEMASHLFK